MHDVVNDWCTAQTSSGPMRVYQSRPESAGSFPGLVVLQEAFGVNDHIQDVCQRFARLGYAVVSPDLFHRQSVEVLPYSEIGRAKEIIATLSDDDVVEDVQAAIDVLHDDPKVDADLIAVVGYCFGGRSAFVAATAIPRLRAAVVYYGSRIVTEPRPPIAAAHAIKGSVLAHFGEDDASIPLDQVRAIRAGLDAAAVDNLVAIYPGAGHGFACDARPAHFEPNATAAAWELTVAFLESALSGQPKPARVAASNASDDNRTRWRNA